MTTIISGDASADFATPLPLSEGGTGSNISGSAPGFVARAWCLFNGTTTGTNAPAAGGNVTSVTRNSAGNYTINFTTAMQDADYAPCISGASSQTTIGSLSAGSFVVTTYNTSGVATDAALVAVAVYK